MFEELMFIILPVFVLVSCVSAVCILSYCKSRILKNPQTPVNNVTNRSNHVSAGSAESRPATTAIFIVPTTSQVIEMYLTQANAASVENVTENPTNYQCKPPPSYGAVVVDVPPSYEQAVVHLGNGAK